MFYYYLSLYIKCTSNHNVFTTKSMINTYVQGRLPQWKYVLRSRNNFPKYKVPTLESDESEHSPIMKYSRNILIMVL